MARLIVHPGTVQAWEIPLREGVNTIGRGDDNHFTIPDDSVSTSHCELFVFGQTVRLKDLGSTNGTRVESSPVTEAVLRPGQTIHLGMVELLFEGDAKKSFVVKFEKNIDATSIPLPPRLPSQTTVIGSMQSSARSKIPKPPPPNLEATQEPAPTVPPRIAPAPSAGPTFCKYHPRHPAHWFCGMCNKSFCDLCVNARAGQHGVRLCRACGEECRELEINITAPEQKSFFAMLPGAFRYPLNGDGIILIVVGTIFYTGIGVAQRISSYAGLLGLVALLITTLFGVGYLFTYAKRLIVSSAEGETQMPDWPEFTDWWTAIISPFFQCLVLVLFCFAPAIVLRLADIESPALGLVARIGAYAIECFILPMTLLAVAMYDSIFALNPMLTLPSIARVTRNYLVAVLLLVLIVVVHMVCDVFMGVIPIPILPTIISGFIGLYLLAVEMRILGLLYLANKQRLGWFRR